MEAEYERCRQLVEAKLDRFFAEESPAKTLLDAMRYSLTGGGKRVRAVLCVHFCKAAGGDEQKAMDAACAVEMLHAYSLIHDDLPCMDDDDLRRGKPSNHIVYGECVATLAGDALQAAAFGTLLGSDLPPDAVVAMGKALAEAAGPQGICGGQHLDMLAGRSDATEAEPDEAGQTEQVSPADGSATIEAQILEMYAMKTSALLVAAAELGVLAAGGDAAQIEAAGEYAVALGLAFQLRDDVLDRTATTEDLGKPAGSDEAGGKATLAALLGTEACEELIAGLTDNAIAALEGAFSDTAFLEWLAKTLATRRH
jgi:geranylgeranyl diphosphate synthase type II